MPPQEFHDTVQLPELSAVARTSVGAAGPSGPVVTSMGADEVCWRLMYAVTVSWYSVSGNRCVRVTAVSPWTRTWPCGGEGAPDVSALMSTT